MSKIFHKLLNTKPSSVNDEDKSVSFVISTNQEDRYGEIVDQKSWNFKDFLKNPVIFWGHTSHEPEYVLGTASSLKVAEDGSETTATLKFDTDINPKADLVFNQIKRGTLRTVSVGFMNHSFEVEDDVPVLKDNDLLEISVVPIPANPGAIALGLKSGEINRKDAKWLMDGLRKEADLMEEQYKSSEPTKKEKSTMTPEQATAMIEGMAKLTEKVDALATENQTLRDQIASEQKTREDEAAAKAEADKKASEEAAAEEAKKQEDLAKGGDNDQPGAKNDDDIDEDAEITPELQAKIDAELEAANTQE